MRKADAIPGGGGGGAWKTSDGRAGDPKWDKGSSLDVGALGQADMFGELVHQKAQNSTLGGEFLLPPFSTLNAREGWWQERKRAWLALGIKSELGRGELAVDPSVSGPSRMDHAAQALKRYNAACPGGSPLPGKGTRAGYEPGVKPGLTVGSGGPGALGSAYRTKAADGLEPGVTDSPGVTYHSQQTADPLYYAKKRTKEAELGRELTSDEFFAEHYVPPDEATATGTSIFDPVLSECCYRWFAPPGGLVLDPFAGGSVRGIVASHLGLRYIGVELRPEQVEANRTQGGIAADPPPEWRQGDSRNIKTIVPEMADVIFSCPPYADLEVYSDLREDISTLKYPEFIKAYREIITASVFRLKRNAFAVFVVGEVRGPKGALYGFVPDTVRAFQDAGLHFWNDAILVTSAGSLPLRAGKQFRASRALGRTHQYVLVFCKGSPAEAASYLAHKEREWR